MIINYVKVRGAIGFKKGLGLDEIEFDMSNKNGLVALAGPNGKGKTTLLELMSPYRTFASRKGALKHHFFLRDSFVETKFSYNGNEYHTIRKIDAGSDRSESFITCNGESVVNGKSKEYDSYIIDLFGSQALFYNSVFCAQGARDLSDLRTGEIKEMFVEFLRIERFAEYEKKTKEYISGYQKKLDTLTGEISAHESSIFTMVDLEKAIESNSFSIISKESAQKDIKKEIDEYSKTISFLENKMVNQKISIEKKNQVEKNLTNLIADRDQAERKVKVLHAGMNAKIEQLKEDRIEYSVIVANKAAIMSAGSRVNNGKKMEKYLSDCFQCSMEEQSRIDSAMKATRLNKELKQEEIDDIKNDLIVDGIEQMIVWHGKNKAADETMVDKLQSALSSAKNDFALHKAISDVENCKKKIAIAIDPDCQSTDCPALLSIDEAKKELPELEKIESGLIQKNEEKILQLESDIKIYESKITMSSAFIGMCNGDLAFRKTELKPILEQAEIELAGYDKGYNSLASDYLIIDDFKGFYRDRLKAVQGKISSLESLASKQNELALAESKIEGIEKSIEDIESDYKDRIKNHSDVFEKLSADILELEKDISIIDDSIESGIQKKLDDAEIKKGYFERKSSDFLTSIEALKKTGAVLESDLKRKNELLKALKIKKNEAATLGKEITEWEYLKLACSKTGLQALEIDGAAPLIVTEANSLLENAFGLDSQIKIVTQDPDSGREVFWIKVIREDGAEDDFQNLSGGQKVWIAKALSLGMTLTSKRKSGRNIESLFSDEADGALDNEKALDFIQLYRSMILTGDFSDFYFVSHNPNVVDMADCIIDFGKL